MATVTYLEHTADMRLRVEGDSLSDAFTALARALGDEISPGTAATSPVREETRRVEGTPAERVVQAANEILYLLQMMRRRPLSVNVVPGKDAWNLAFRWVPAAEVTGEVKAATYHAIRVDLGEGKVVLEITFDR